MKPPSARKKPGFSAIRYKYDAYKARAKRVEKEFSIPFEEFETIVTQNCSYCGSPPRPFNQYVKSDGTRNRKGSLISDEWISVSTVRVNGIYRKDNSLGYVIGNCVACCEQCNKSKLTYTVKEFLDHANRIAIHQKSLDVQTTQKS